MRILRINDINVDIDDETAIGIDFQSYDIKQPGKNFINISNTFTIPLTANNKAIFGNAEDPQSLSTKVYESAVCNYWVDNNQLIRNAKCRVENIQDRISLFIFQKANIWDLLKSVLWDDFITDYLDWAENVKGVAGVGISNQFTNPGLFIENFRTATEDIVLPLYYGNLFDYDPTGAGPVETVTSLALEWWDNSTDGVGKGGHFCIYVKSIFEYIEYAYDVNFLTSGGVLPGNIWDDPIASNLYVPARELETTVVGNPPVKLWISKHSKGEDVNFLPLKNVEDKADKTLYDLANSFFQHFNMLIDELFHDGEEVIRLARFDDLETADVVDWSGRTSGTPLFKPIVQDIYQENTIKFKEIYPEGDSLLNSKVLTCNNVNIDFSSDLFEIDAYVNSLIDRNAPSGEFVPDLTIKESFKTFSFFLHGSISTTSTSITIKTLPYGFYNFPGSWNLYPAELYDLDSEYNFYDEIIERPKTYDLEKWFKVDELKDFEFFKQYFIRELNGSFFINKINGFNPDKSKEPTTIEIIRISDRTPIVDPDLDYWEDGVQDPFTDGDGDYFF
jgi:hypothetical protein